MRISFLPNMRSQILLKACARGARRAWLAVVPTDEAKLSRREDLVGWSIDREAERHSIPKTPNFADFSSTGAARLPHLPASGVWLGRRESGIEASRATARLESTARVWTIDSHHQIDSKLLFCPAEGSPDPRRRREELSRATLKAEAAAAALLSTIGANDPPRV